MLKNPNTPYLWDRVLFEQNETLLKSPFYIDKIRTVVEFLKKIRGKFLDIGFGRGNLEREMVTKKIGLDIWGADISSKGVKHAKKTLNGNFFLASIFKLPFGSSFFNAVAILDVLEHIFEKDIYRALKEVNRVTKKSGVLIVSVPLNEDLKLLNKEKRNFNRHVREYTLEVLERELKWAGFVVRREKYIYAFKNNYQIKTLLTKFFPDFWKPNLLIIYAIKK